MAGWDPPLPLSASIHIAVFLPYLHYVPLTSGGLQPLMLSTRRGPEVRGISHQSVVG